MQATTMGAMRAYQEEKRILFANALYHSAVDLDLDTDKKIFFFSLLNDYTLSHMLLKCTAAQIDDFRKILLAVYQDVGKNSYDEKDIEAMRLLIKLLDNSWSEEHHWNKIQLLHIDWLCKNLNKFIHQMS